MIPIHCSNCGHEWPITGKTVTTPYLPPIHSPSVTEILNRLHSLGRDHDQLNVAIAASLDDLRHEIDHLREATNNMVSFSRCILDILKKQQPDVNIDQRLAAIEHRLEVLLPIPKDAP
jgi:hypothetical protein